MKKQVLTLLMIISPLWMLAQRAVVELKEMKMVRNGASFETKEVRKIDTTFEVPVFQNVIESNSNIDSLLFNGKKNTYIGPVRQNGYTFLYFVKYIDSVYSMRAGQILIDPIHFTEKEIDSIATNIISQIKSGHSFDSMCKKYSFSDNGEHDCDLGWFKSGVMVLEFEKAVLAHKKNDVFQVKTIFGTHIVKVLEDSLEDSRTSTIIEYKLKD
ncbi:peptidylprolyl isomerase [Phnomibacter sp. MR]|uniref:peptidylprolyl isomerase n=1 Tax=Phnomibacter sp. MR TaxID=3042318 RepID=UPI003A8023E3